MASFLIAAPNVASGVWWLGAVISAAAIVNLVRAWNRLQQKRRNRRACGAGTRRQARAGRRALRNDLACSAASRRAPAHRLVTVSAVPAPDAFVAHTPRSELEGLAPRASASSGHATLASLRCESRRLRRDIWSGLPCGQPAPVVPYVPRAMARYVVVRWYYWSSLSTAFGSAFAWASIATPACCRTWSCVNVVISVAMLTSLIELSAACKFCW